MKKIIQASLLCSFLLGGFTSAQNPELFPKPGLYRSASTPEFRHYLYAGSETGRLVNHGNLGLEYPVFGFTPKGKVYCLFGVAASAHLVMFPENMKFDVDNFYATLAVYADGFRSEKTSCRFYPVFHVSGHLGDGAKDDSALIYAQAVSSEMARLEISLTPVPSMTFSAGYGYYYHVCAQKGMTDRFDIALFCNLLRDKQLRPYFIVSGLLTHMNRWRSGVDIETGIKLMNSRRIGMGLSFRYFNKMHPGYYFDKREESAGIQVSFYQ